MNMRSFLIVSFFLLNCSVFAQLNILPSAGTSDNKLKKHAKWSYKLEPSETSVGKIVTIILTAEIEDGWYMYSSDFDPNIGPKVTEIIFNNNSKYKSVGKLIPVQKPQRKYEEIWPGEVAYFIGKAQFKQRVKILEPNPVIEATIEYQTCTIKDGSCVPEDFDLKIEDLKVNLAEKPAPTVDSGLTRPLIKSQDDSLSKGVIDSVDEEMLIEPPKTSSEPSAINNPDTKPVISLWAFFLKAFIFGLAALITPCVFPMIPMTVSFFTHTSKSRSESIRKALLYGLSIIGIYTLIGTSVASVFGSDAPNFISTHWLPNVLFFGVFIVFAFSFLGMFEIVLPSSLVNKIDQQSEKGGYAGIFFMAFTIVLVSFSCTGPIVGTVLIESFGGMFIKPIVGMFGFSLAFAIPFALFAMFPSWLKSLPKSGGWLNSVKVTLGFLELAFALKFLSQADQVYQWRILDREIFLAFWIVIFSLLGLYLLKRFKLSHDDEDYTRQSVSVPGLMLAISAFAFVAYLVPGMFGAPLKALSGYLPPMHTLDFKNSESVEVIKPVGLNNLCEDPKYADMLHTPHGLQGYFDLKQAQECAKKQNKPLFIDFTGLGCANCREMEAIVWSHPEVLKRLQEDFVIVSLYVDVRTELPESQWYVSAYDGKTKKSIGKQNSDLEISVFKNNAQPLYVVTDLKGNQLVEPKGYDRDAKAFIAFLDEAKKNFKRNL